MTMKFRPILSACLGLGVTLGSLPALAAPAPTRVGTAQLDRQGQTLLIPYQGHVPAVTIQRLAPMHYIADLGDAVLAKEEVQCQAVGGNHLLAGWSLDETPSGHNVRLRLTLTQDVDPQLRFEQIGHSALRLSMGADAPRFQLTQRNLPVQAAFARPIAVPKTVVLPTRPAPRAPFALALPTGVAMVAPVHHGPAVLGTPHFDARRNCLVVPVTGVVDPTKLAVVQLGKRWAYLDLPGSHPSFSDVKYQDRSSQQLQRWVMAKRPHVETTRLSFNLQAGAALDVKLAGKELLVAVRPPAAVVARALPGRAAPVAVAASVAKAAPVATAAPTGTTFQRPYFDQARRGLVIPYTGEAPVYRFNEQQDAAATLEIKGALAPLGKLEQHFGNHAVMQAWQVERNAGAGTISVGMSFRHPAELVVALDPSHHQLLLLPQPRVAGGDVAAAAEPVGTLSAARLPAEGRQIFIPYTGRVPAYSIEQVSATQAYVDFEGAQLEANAVQYAEPPFHPTVSHWLLTERAQQHLVRLALTLHQPGGVAVFQDRTNQRLVVELNGDEPQLGARARSQKPGEWPGEQRLVGKKAS
ncbi:MAG: hypothetical protein JWM80_3070 [Cyanobacteria bacterium RYN_339]|nr:hypothetical protein [Cyanobacteria bacterium RYN_339]